MDPTAPTPKNASRGPSPQILLTGGASAKTVANEPIWVSTPPAMAAKLRGIRK